MNIKHFAKGLLFGASLLLASAAFAGEKGSVKIYDEVKVSGKTLPAGDYQFAWDGTGSNVQVTIRQGGTTVATVPADVEPSKTAPTNAGYATKQDADGSRTVTTVFFSGKKVLLNLDQTAAAASAPTPGNK